jgi:hypothetical protein
MTTWSQPTTAAEAIARARGRAKYNSIRHLAVSQRRAEVLRLYLEFGGGRGVQTRIAEVLGVSRSTVCRDLRIAPCATSQPCPTCRTEVSNRRWRRLAKDGAVSRGLDPRSVAGQAEALAAEVVNSMLPRVLADLGFFVGDDGRLEDEHGLPLPDAAPTFGEVAGRAQEAFQMSRPS